MAHHSHLLSFNRLGQNNGETKPFQLGGCAKYEEMLHAVLLFVSEFLQEVESGAGSGGMQGVVFGELQSRLMQIHLPSSLMFDMDV